MCVFCVLSLIEFKSNVIQKEKKLIQKLNSSKNKIMIYLLVADVSKYWVIHFLALSEWHNTKNKFQNEWK